MPITRDIKNRKGISPITTVALLIITLLIIGGIIYMWMSIQNRAGNAIQIQSIAKDQNKTIIYVQNIGNGIVTIDSVQINALTFSIQTANCTVASQETTTITQGQTAKIIINQAYNERAHIRVICKDGTFYERDWQP